MKNRFPGFEKCLAMMRSRNPVEREEGFGVLLPEAKRFVPELIAAFRSGLRCDGSDTGPAPWSSTTTMNLSEYGIAFRLDHIQLNALRWCGLDTTRVCSIASPGPPSARQAGEEISQQAMSLEIGAPRVAAVRPAALPMGEPTGM